MKPNKRFVVLLIAFFSFYSFCRDTLIPVPDGYAWGEFAEDNNFPQFAWHNDTITFSCGARITFYYLNSEILVNTSHPGIRGLWMVGLVVIGNGTQPGYKYALDLKKGQPYNTFPKDLYLCTYNNPDTNWNNALTYPDSISPIDTFYNIGDDTTNSMFLYEGDVYCISMYPHVYEYHTNTYNYKPMLYLLTGNMRKIKLQISRLKIINGQVDSMYFNWAADSSGNGKFKHPAVGIVADHTIKKPSSFSVYKAGSQYYLKLNEAYSAKKEYRVTIYDIKGRKMFYQKNMAHDSIKLSGLKQGIYVICLSYNSKKAMEKITIIK